MDDMSVGLVRWLENYQSLALKMVKLEAVGGFLCCYILSLMSIWFEDWETR